MQFARRLWIAAACTLGVLLGASAAQAQNTKLLPNDTEMTITFNLQQILKSDVLKGNKAILDLAKGKISEGLEDKGIDKWLKKADFNLFKDLTSVTFASNSRDVKEPFILFEGNFDAEKIEAAAVEANKENGLGLRVIKIGGVKVFEVTPKGEKAMYIGVLSKKTMVVCTKADFTEVAARFKGEKSPNFKSDAFKALVSTVNPKQSISIVATSNILLKVMSSLPEGANAQAQQITPVLKQMEGVSAAVTIQKNIDFQIGVNTKDADTATKYAGLGNILVGAAKAKVGEQAKQNEKFAPAVDVINTVRITSQGSNLMIRGQISFETLEKIIQGLPIPQ